jgi:hypothetical protein
MAETPNFGDASLTGVPTPMSRMASLLYFAIPGHRDPGSCEGPSSGALSRDPLHYAALRVQDDLLNWIRLIWVVQSPSQKYSGSLLTQITSISAAIPAHTKGRFAIVTDVGSGCDGRGWRC